MNVIGILCPIEVEYRAVSRYLSNKEEQIKEGATYEIGHFVGKNQAYKVVIRQTGSKNTDIALATDRIIRNFNPCIVLLVGIAGGVKDVTIGDIVVATKAYGYGGGKAVDGSFLARPESFPYDTELIDQARSVARQSYWEQKIAYWKKVPKVVFGPIASGDVVIASTQSPEFQILKNHYNDTTAIEMESIGFAKAAFSFRQVRIMNIRGISDLLDKKSETDAQGSQEMASDYAAAFAFTFLELIDLKHFTQFNNTTTGEIRKLISNNKVKQAIEQLLQLTASKDKASYNDVSLLQQNWNDLQRKERLGIISNSETNLGRNNIIHSLLEIISDLEG